MNSRVSRCVQTLLEISVGAGQASFRSLQDWPHITVAILLEGNLCNASNLPFIPSTVHHMELLKALQ